MKKTGIAIGVIIGSLVVISIIGRVFGFLNWYTIPNLANEPGIMTGEKIIVTNFRKAGYYNFVTYKCRMTDSLSAPPGSEEEIKEQNYVHRLCGMPGDKLQMKNGVLYVNGKNFDSELDLRQEFMVSQPDIEKLDKNDFSGEKYEVHPLNYLSSPDTMIVSLDKKLQQKYSRLITLVPYIITDPSIHGTTFKWYNNLLWTPDNFGPLTIPADSCFVMGDNRHNSLDSRYTGFIAMKDISGVVINK